MLACASPLHPERAKRAREIFRRRQGRRPSRRCAWSRCRWGCFSAWKSFPRSHKFTVGNRLIETCLEAQTSLVEASYVRDKRGLLLGASRALVRARVLARLATALHALSLEQEAHL